MEKIKKYHICDRCKEELIDKPIIEYDYERYYELCNDCDEAFKEYKNKAKLLENKYDEITKKYKFGKYLPKDNLESEVN